MDVAGEIESEERMEIRIPAFDPLHVAGPQKQIKAQFRGTDRKTPKTTIAVAPRHKSATR
jgi:hypothetical protein